ncbi:ATP-citrate synthase beta chain protein 2-like isoform X2 [Actinidia eriantha]|uniref:ATP-citrate synthase beta chain protein 2-like isoform X2 n=1 Tax=Actinidia eriantha TaxID=165200 RepID=UPI0025867A1F|nr:ATP-citrate synthase beta chain protein 2-like isoform X2 [Actinidia eriantha]
MMQCLSSFLALIFIKFSLKNNRLLLTHQLLEVFRMELSRYVTLLEESMTLFSLQGSTSDELYNTIAHITDGIYEDIAIGGHVFPGSTLSNHVLRSNNIPQIKMIFVLGELGGCDEYSLVNRGRINKPVVAWVGGPCTTLFKSEVQFGHAGSKSGGEMESACRAQAKNQALCDAGSVDPTSYEAFDIVIKEAFEKLAEEGKISLLKEVKLHKFPRILISLLRVENSELQLILSPPYQMAEGLAPYEFVERMKKKSIRVPGIGHSQPGLLTCYCSFQIDQERQQHR